MRIARTLASFAAFAAVTAFAAGPALADPAAPLPAIPAAAPAATVPAVAAPVANAVPAAAAAVPGVAAIPGAAAVPGAATVPAVSVPGLPGSIPASAQPAIAQLAQNPAFAQIIKTGQLPTTDVGTLMQMVGSDPNAQKLLAQVLGGSGAGAAAPAATLGTTPNAANAAVTPVAAVAPAEPLKFPVTGAIGDAFNAAGGQSKLGNSTSPEKALAAGAKYQDFTNGTIYWAPKINNGKAMIVQGAIRDAYTKAGGPTGRLGLPTLTETTVPGLLPSTPAGAWNDFEHGTIFWSPDSGAHPIEGKIRDQWLQAGGANGLGAPKADAGKVGGKLSQDFVKGTISA
jgi:hypothetical protein